jgi:hypothetical protein
MIISIYAGRNPVIVCGDKCLLTTRGQSLKVFIALEILVTPCC